MDEFANYIHKIERARKVKMFELPAEFGCNGIICWNKAPFAWAILELVETFPPVPFEYNHDKYNKALKLKTHLTNAIDQLQLLLFLIREQEIYFAKLSSPTVDRLIDLWDTQSK